MEMRFDLTDEQAQLSGSVERFVREHYDMAAWRTAARSPEGYREALWQRMASMGWLGATIPEAYGGLGLGDRERAVIMEGIGRGLIQEPYWSTSVLGVELVLAAGTQHQKQAWLPQVAEGRWRLAFACWEPGQRYDWQAGSCIAEEVPGGYRLTGRKIAVLDAPCADRILVLARTGGPGQAGVGLALFCVDAHAAGLGHRTFRTLDERRCADLDFHQIFIAAADRLGEGDDVSPAVQSAMDRAMVALCAEAVGAMSVALQSTIDYLKTRKQFGRQLSEFQALRHRVADMVMATEQTRSLAWMAALSLDGEPAQRMRLAAAAKVQAGQAGRYVGESAIQLHGGIGMTDELHVGHYFKRLLSIDFLLGDAPHHLRRLAELDPLLGLAPSRPHSGASPCH